MELKQNLRWNHYLSYKDKKEENEFIILFFSFFISRKSLDISMESDPELTKHRFPNNRI